MTRCVYLADLEDDDSSPGASLSSAIGHYQDIKKLDRRKSSRRDPPSIMIFQDDVFVSRNRRRASPESPGRKNTQSTRRRPADTALVTGTPHRSIIAMSGRTLIALRALR
jgi:hypothetical protein